MESILFFLEDYMYFLIISVVFIALVFLLDRYFDGPKHGVKKTDFRNKFVVITGGNSGIGVDTVMQLAELGCHVLIGARDTRKSQEVVKKVIKKTGNINIDHASLNLGDKKSIENFAHIMVKFQHIDYLINNAGVMAIPNRRQTTDGYEWQFGINHMGHFYLTYLLWPKIKKSSFFRIINVSSLAHKRINGFGAEPTLDFKDLNSEKSYDEVLVYSRSKLCNVLFTRALAQRINPKDGLVVSLHPGVVRTDLTRDLKNSMQILLKIITPIFWIFSKSSFMGSQTTMFTALSNKIKNGCYYADCQVNQENSFVKKQNWDQLWKISENLSKISFNV